MLDIWPISITAFKGVQNSRVCTWDILGAHTAIELQITSSLIEVNGESNIAKIQIG